MAVFKPCIHGSQGHWANVQFGGYHCFLLCFCRFPSLSSLTLGRDADCERIWHRVMHFEGFFACTEFMST